MATAPHARRAVVRSTGPVSPLDEALRRVGDRWTLLVVEALLPGPRRFGELLEELDGLAPNILLAPAQGPRGRRAGLRPRPTPGAPTGWPTPSRRPGAELAGALRLLAQWGSHRSPAGAAPLHHATCGTTVEARWWCPTCERDVADDEAPDLHFL